VNGWIPKPPLSYTPGVAHPLKSFRYSMYLDYLCSRIY
jgi:hypothetical protein